jgi:gas vesicle protein
MKTSNAIMGIIGGVAVGAALGLLFAPEKGEKTRKKISKKANDIASSTKSKLEDLAQNFKGTAQNAIDDSIDILEKEKSNLENIKKINKPVL